MSSVRRGQLALLPPTAKTLAALTATSCARRVLDAHVMEIARPLLRREALNSGTAQGCHDGDVARVAGRVVIRQRPLARAVFLTLEDEWGLIPIAVWEGRWERMKYALHRRRWLSKARSPAGTTLST